MAGPRLPNRDPPETICAIVSHQPYLSTRNHSKSRAARTSGPSSKTHSVYKTGICPQVHTKGCSRSFHIRSVLSIIAGDHKESIISDPLDSDFGPSTSPTRRRRLHPYLSRGRAPQSKKESGPSRLPVPCLLLHAAPVSGTPSLPGCGGRCPVAGTGGRARAIEEVVCSVSVFDGAGVSARSEL